MVARNIHIDAASHQPFGQHCSELASRRPACGGILLESALQNRPQLRVSRRDFGDRHEVVFDDGAHERVEVRALESGSTRDALVENDADRPDVRPGVDGRITTGLLRGHVPRAAERSPLPREGVLGYVEIGLGDAEVEDLRPRASGFAGQKDIFRFQIAVNDFPRVRQYESVEHGQKYLDRLHWSYSAARGEQGREGLTLQQVHHDERVAVVRLSEVEDPHDRGVIQPCCDACLLQEESAGVLAGEIRPKQLQRDV
jgi:hypothetical protein